MRSLPALVTAAAILAFQVAGSDSFSVLLGQGEAAFDRKDYKTALRVLRHAELLLRDSPPDSAERARVHNAYGALYLVKGKLTAAREHLLRALEVLERNGDGTDRVAVLQNLAGIEMQSSRLREAMQHQSAAVELCRRGCGHQDGTLLKTLINLSTLQGLLGEWSAAEETLREVLSVEESPAALANYTVVLKKLGRDEKARSIEARAGTTLPQSGSLIDVRALQAERGTMRVRSQ